MLKILCLFLGFLLVSNGGFSEAIPEKKTICLNMVIKDESFKIRGNLEVVGRDLRDLSKMFVKPRSYTLNSD